MREINKIIVHCSATKPSMNIGVNEIRQWHLEKGWSDIGYHWVITRDGITEEGRPEEKSGAHAKGHNSDSIGICLVGGINETGKPDANFNVAQYLKLESLVDSIKRIYGDIEVLGHRDLPGVTKACPCFDVKELLYGIFE